MLKRLIVAGSLLLLISCERMTNIFNNTTNKIQRAIQRAEAVLPNTPDSAIHITADLLSEADSLKIADQFRLKIYQLRVKAFKALGKTDSTLSNGQLVRETAALIPDSLAIAESILDLYSNVDFKYLKRSYRFLPGAIATFQKADRKYETGIATAVYGVYLSNKGDYLTAQKYFMQSYKIFTEIDSLKALARVCNSLGNNYARIGSMKESSEFYNSALQAAESAKDTLLQASILINIGVNYKSSFPDSAIYFYQRALSLLPANYKGNLTMKASYNLANVYMQNNAFDKAKAIFNNILQRSIETKYQEGIAMAYGGLGSLYNNMKQYGLAIQYYQIAIKALETSGQSQVMMMLLPELIIAYKASGDLKNTLFYTDQFYGLKDSLVSVEKTAAIHELEKQYQIERQELENAQLKTKLSAKQTTNVLLIGLLIIMCALVILFRQRNHYHLERNKSYEVLIAKYRQEKLEKERVLINRSDTSTNAVKGKQKIQAEGKSNDLFEDIKSYYASEKPYLNEALKIEDIAITFNTSTKDVFQSIKDNGYRNFKYFTNKYRVEEVRRMFEDESFKNQKLDAIWAKAGFGSKPPFYSAFIEETGIKPAYYRAMINKNSDDIA